MYLKRKELIKRNFKYIGKNVLISDKASIYNTDQIEIGDNSRIDDFVIISGKIKIGSFVHIAAHSYIGGGVKGVKIEDFAGLAHHVQVFSQSDDYSGRTMTNPTVDEKFKNVIRKKVIIKKHSIVGAGSIIMPGVTLNEGTAVGVMSLIRENTEPWSTYIGNPSKKIKNRSKDLLLLEKKFIKKNNHKRKI